MRHFAIFPRSSRNSPYAKIEKAGDATSRVDSAASELRRASTTRSSPLFLMSFMLRSAQFHRAMLGLQSGRGASSFSHPSSSAMNRAFSGIPPFSWKFIMCPETACVDRFVNLAHPSARGKRQPGSEMAHSPVDVAERFCQASELKRPGSEVAVTSWGRR